MRFPPLSDIINGLKAHDAAVTAGARHRFLCFCLIKYTKQLEINNIKSLVEINDSRLLGEKNNWKFPYY